MEIKLYDPSEYNTVKVINYNNKKLTDIEYYRDIESINIEEIYYLYRLYNIKDISTLNKGIIGAYLLKWLYEDKIKIDIKDFKFIIKKKTHFIDFSNFDYSSNIDRSLANLLLDSNESKQISFKKVGNNLKNNHNKMISWFNDIMYYAKENLINKGIFEKVIENRRDEESRGLKKLVFYNTTDKSNELLEKYRGIERYINDFGRLEEKAEIEVKLWYKYLMFAELIGVDEKIKEKLNSVYKDIPEYYKYNEVLVNLNQLKDNINLIIKWNVLKNELNDAMPRTGILSAVSSSIKNSPSTSSDSVARNDARDYDSGGKGFSSRLGGLKSFGGNNHSHSSTSRSGRGGGFR